MRKCIVLINPFWAGHHATFFKIFSQTINTLDYTVVTLSQNPEALSGMGDYHFQISASHMEIGKSPKEKTAFWAYCDQQLHEISKVHGLKINLVFFLTLDSMMHRELESTKLDKLFSFPWAGLYFTPRPKKKNLLKKLKTLFKKENLSIFQSQNCRFVGILDEGYRDILAKKIKKPVVVFPDFIDTAEANMDFPVIEEILRCKGDRKIIGLYGAIEKRKGLLTFLRTVEKTETDDWLFVVAGKIKRDYFSDDENHYIDEMIRKQPANCYFYFEFIPTEHEFNALIQISDLVFAAYRDFPHSSNLITKAAYFSKPVVVSSGYLMAERVKENELGYVIDQDSIHQLIDVLQNKVKGGFNPQKAEAYFKNNSLEYLRSVLQKTLAE